LLILVATDQRDDDEPQAPHTIIVS
jgi:hypothetical protein